MRRGVLNILYVLIFNEKEESFMESVTTLLDILGRIWVNV